MIVIMYSTWLKLVKYNYNDDVTIDYVVSQNRGVANISTRNRILVCAVTIGRVYIRIKSVDG